MNENDSSWIKHEEKNIVMHVDLEKKWDKCSAGKIRKIEKNVHIMGDTYVEV